MDYWHEKSPAVKKQGYGIAGYLLAVHETVKTTVYCRKLVCNTGKFST